MNEWTNDTPLRAAINLQCRLNRAQTAVAGGDWDEAIRQIVKAKKALIALQRFESNNRVASQRSTNGGTPWRP